MANVGLKYPPFRDEEQVKRLSSLLLHFPKLLPQSLDPLVREKIATWISAERITERKGISLPREGGLYIILKGRVQETLKDSNTGEYTTNILRIGEVFGEMKEMAYPPKLSYPTYVGEKNSIVLRVTLNDLTRAKEMIKERQLHVHLQFIETSPLLKTFPLHIRQKLAMNIQWKEIPAKTKVLIEGEPIVHLSVIKEGRCKVTKSTTCLALEKVCIGEIGEGACIGELVIEGCEISPYTVISVAPLHVGQITVQCIRALAMQELLTSEQRYSINLPSEEILQKMYAEKQMNKQWNSLKKTIIDEVYKEKQGARTKSAFS
ncbi:PREDICTED: uncharacterized protein LOC100632146 isoform X2 [Amphimedon queenslandica]|nr:PREDICTED: uncharacterized protein LOC100632146 isoform X2 [Amphimedon queenslandica]|eukprot:XP_019864330.1 PREDICTED: uncharacterized protein LOC100632146 isoform X2 [Amphimedon queenslandica]